MVSVGSREDEHEDDEAENDANNKEYSKGKRQCKYEYRCDGEGEGEGEIHPPKWRLRAIKGCYSSESSSVTDIYIQRTSSLK